MTRTEKIKQWQQLKKKNEGGIPLTDTEVQLFAELQQELFLFDFSSLKF